MNRINLIFASNLSALVQQTGRSQREVAEKMGVPAPNLSVWMQGIKLPRPDALEVIAAFFGVCVADLFAEPGTVPKPPKTDASDLLDLFNSLNDKSKNRVLAYALALKDTE